MSDENRRIDLSQDLDALATDIDAAAEEVKARREADASGSIAAIEKLRSRKISAILVGIGAVVVLLISYWVVFARPESQAARNGSVGGVSQAQSQPATTAPIKNPCVTPTPPRAPHPGSASAGRDSQVVEHSPEGYEQPSDDPGM